MGTITSRTNITSREQVQQILKPFIFHDIDHHEMFEMTDPSNFPKFTFFIHKYSKKTYDDRSPFLRRWPTSNYYLSTTHSQGGGYISFVINEDGSILDKTWVPDESKHGCIQNGMVYRKEANITYPSFLHFVGQGYGLACIMHPNGSIKNINKLFPIPSRVPHTINFSSIHDFSLKQNEVIPILKPKSVVFIDHKTQLFKTEGTPDMSCIHGRNLGITFSPTGHIKFGYSGLDEYITFKELFESLFFVSVEFIYCGNTFGYLTVSEFLIAIEGFQPITPVIDSKKYVTNCGKLLKNKKSCSDCASDITY